jgi:hypothetical protein
MRKILITAFVIIAIFSAAVSAQDNIEKKKIEFLIASIQNTYFSCCIVDINRL